MKRFISAIMSVMVILTVFAAFPVVSNAASMDDATFFAKFNYSASPELLSVKSFADQGDYHSAKAALLEYFKNRKQTSQISGFGITKADEFYGMAVLPMRNILTGPYEFDMWQAEFDVTSSSFSEYEVDVTDRIASQLNNGAVSFMLFAGDKQQYPVLVESKESGNAPKLVIQYSVDGEDSTVTVTADNDTYISSRDIYETYGTETVLYIKEDGTGSDSTGSNTRRTYINFPLSDAANSTIISAKLVLSAAYAPDCSTGDKTVLVLNVGDTMWNENSLTWNGTRGSIYSYQNASVPTWDASAPNADTEYHNVTSRFWFGRPMAYEYLSYLEDPQLYNETHPYSDVYPGEEFGPKLVELMDAFASQMYYGYKRTLETGERLNRWVDIIDALLETDVFDERLDEFCNIISFMWGDCNYLAGLNIADDKPWWSNWRIVANAGFFKAVEYFPEFSTHSQWRKKVEYNVEYTFDLLYNDDYSFTEAGPSYAAWCAKLFGDCIKAAKMSGNPMSAAFTEKVKYAARNALESYYPNGYDTNIGDSNFRDQMYYFEMLNEVFDKSDSVIDSYVSGKDKGAEYLTRYYHRANSAYMRNSWNPDDAVYLNFTNNPSDGHCHPDSNQVLMYAYGSPLLVDSGRYSYSSTNSIHDTLRTAQSHNTIEADGLKLADHSASTAANSFAYSNTNDIFDFASSEQHGYTNVSHTRNVFFARNGFSIVTDYVSGNTNRTYRQNWHFMPSSNASASGTAVSTDFYNAPNITVAAASADSTSVKPGYHSADYGLVAESEYASFEKHGSTVKFDTLLYPDRKNTQTPVAASDLAANDSSKAAVKITIDGEDSYYYVKNTASSDGKFAAYTTDAKMAYVSANEYMIVDGKSVSGKIESLNTICSMGVVLDNGTVTLSGEKLIANKTSDAIKIYAPNTTNVIFNGQSISFTQSGDYIYAVSSAVAESVTGAVAKVYPDKDGFEASVTAYDGKNNPQIIQAACAWQNRNAYMAFDLSDFKYREITSAVLKMYTTEVANNPRNLHFYYLDYGTWTRDNLSFILDDSKMPTHTANSGNYTGFSYRWQGDVSNANVSNYISLTTNLPSYLANNSNYKFTWAILSDSGSIKFSSINAEQAHRPYLEITYNYTTSSAPDPTVTVKKYADGVLKSSNTENAKLGEVYLYEADESVTYNGSKYYIDHAVSNLSTVVQNGNNLVEIYYSSAACVTVNFEDTAGSAISEPVTVWLNPSQPAYNYAPVEMIENDGIIYMLDLALSTLSCTVEDGAVLTAAYKKAYTVANGTNLVTNGSFEDENGFSLAGWLSAEGNKEFGSPYTTNHCYAVNSTTAISGNVSTSISTTIPDGEWAFGSRWNDGQNGLCTLKRYVPVTQGKTYLVSYKVKHKEGSDGGFLKTSLVASNGANEENTTNPSYIGTEWTSVDRIFTATDDTDYVLFWFRWLGADGNPGHGPYWFFDDFRIREIDEVEYINVTIDGKPAVTESKLFLGEKTDSGYKLPAGIMGYIVTSVDNSVKFVNAGEYSPTDGDIITSVPVNVNAVTGAQVRIGNGLKDDGTIDSNSGLRFIAQIDRSNINDSDFSYGMEITAEDSTNIIDIPIVTYQDEEHTTFTAALTNLKTSNYNRYYTARPYVNVKYSDGTTAKIYAEESITRSIYQVSVGLLKSGSNGLENNDDIYGVGENSALYKVLNAYVNMVGIRLNLSSNGDIAPTTSGDGSYRGDVFFSAVCTKTSDNSYSVTVTPLADFSYKVTIASYWNDFIRINNNTSIVKNCISNSQTYDDGSISFDFTLPER